MLFPRILTRRSELVHMDCDFRLTGSAVRRALMGTCDELEKMAVALLMTIDKDKILSLTLSLFLSCIYISLYLAGRRHNQPYTVDDWSRWCIRGSVGFYRACQKRMCVDGALNLCHLGWYD